jgi:uncharacterized ion transporter superfamily protein YfcC
MKTKNIIICVILLLIILIIGILFYIINNNNYEHFVEQSNIYKCDSFYKTESQCDKNLCVWEDDKCKTKCIEYNNIDPHQKKVLTCQNDKNCVWNHALYYNECIQKLPIGQLPDEL